MDCPGSVAAAAASSRDSRLIGDQLFADGFDLLGGELVQAIGEADQQRQIGQPVDLPRNAVAEIVKRFEGVGREDFARGAGGARAGAGRNRRFPRP